MNPGRIRKSLWRQKSECYRVWWGPQKGQVLPCLGEAACGWEEGQRLEPSDPRRSLVRAEATPCPPNQHLVDSSPETSSQSQRKVCGLGRHQGGWPQMPTAFRTQSSSRDTEVPVMTHRVHTVPTLEHFSILIGGDSQQTRNEPENHLVAQHGINTSKHRTSGSAQGRGC